MANSKQRREVDIPKKLTRQMINDCFNSSVYDWLLKDAKSKHNRLQEKVKCQK